MRNDKFLVFARFSDTAVTRNGLITASEQEFRELGTTEEIAKTVSELWDKTQWFLIFRGDKWGCLQNSGFVADNEPYSSKEGVANSIKKLLDDGAVGILVEGGKFGRGRLFLQFVKEV